jgi:hypothetical protein
VATGVAIAGACVGSERCRGEVASGVQDFIDGVRDIFNRIFHNEQTDDQAETPGPTKRMIAETRIERHRRPWKAIPTVQARLISVEASGDAKKGRLPTTVQIHRYLIVAQEATKGDMKLEAGRLTILANAM